MAREADYLIELVHAWAAGRQVGPTLPRGVAPETLWELLRAHNVETSLGPLLPGESRPADAARTMAESRHRTEILLLECERILPTITAAAGRAVLLKGAALALGAYPRPADRWFLDLDVLVPRDRVAPVCAALEAVGYRSLQGARNPLYYEKHHLHRILLGPQGSVVEVHWDLTLPHSVYRCDLDGVFARAEERPLGRLHAACAAPVDQIIHGVYQNIADGFVDLRRVMDMALLVRDHPDLDWGRLVGLAVNSGMDKALWISLHNMKLISGIGAPQSALNVLAPAGATRRTLLGLDTAAGCLRRRASRSEGYTPLLHLLLTPTPSRQFRELLRAAWVGEELLLDRGYDPARLPGFGRRTLIGLTRLRMLARAGMLASWAWVTG